MSLSVTKNNSVAHRRVGYNMTRLSRKHHVKKRRREEKISESNRVKIFLFFSKISEESFQEENQICVKLPRRNVKDF